MKKRELSDIMSKMESEFVCVHEFLNSHEETVRSGECNTEIKGLEDVEFPFYNVLLSKFGIS